MDLWNHLYDIYTDFNQRLASQGLAYEGALYRHVIEADTLDLRYDTYLFVGFNMMQQVETALYRRIKQDASCHFTGIMTNIMLVRIKMKRVSISINI